MTQHGGKRTGAGRPTRARAISTELRQAAQERKQDALWHRLKAVFAYCLKTAQLSSE